LNLPLDSKVRAPERVVLDTNVALALWVFGDPALDHLRFALEAGQLRWVACDAMLGEFWHEVRPERCEAYGTRSSLVQERVNRVRQERVANPPMLGTSSSPTKHLRCTDRDDQVFIDVALACQVPLLLSRDRAVLKLRKRAAREGLTIAKPESWGVVDKVPLDPGCSRP
jgi:uncharacterized protein